MNISNASNVNAAIVSGQSGLQRATQGIAQASANIASQPARLETAPSTPAETNNLPQPQRQADQVLASSDNLLDNIVSLTVNQIQGQSAARVIGVANENVGRLIDELV